jgi:hypothetical protein
MCLENFEILFFILAGLAKYFDIEQNSNIINTCTKK